MKQRNNRKHVFVVTAMVSFLIFLLAANKTKMQELLNYYMVLDNAVNNSPMKVVLTLKNEQGAPRREFRLGHCL